MTQTNRSSSVAASGRAGRRSARQVRRAARNKTRVEKAFFGVSLAAVGIVAWGIQQDREWAEGLIGWWPLLLVWLGLGDLLATRFVTGIGLLTAGGLALLHVRETADFEYTWPLILVAMGVVMTLSALVGKGGPLDAEAETTKSETIESEGESHG